MASKSTKISVSLLGMALLILAIVAAVRLGPTWGIVFTLATSIAVATAVLLYLLLRYLTSTTTTASLPKLNNFPRGGNISFIHRIAGVPTNFTYKELEHATDNFNSLVGRGGSGTVFRGILNDGTAVAVKRIESGEKESGEKEFLSEVAAIASVQHVNLVRLFGFCVVPSGPRFLVYEFVENGSLDGWLFARRDPRKRAGGCLPWRLRCRVAVDVAKALSYLHHDCRSRILHLDVKPENILLDGGFKAVLADFGLSKLMAKEESRVVTRVRGTHGYLAPEWILEQGISEKSDVYSYGIVLLELIAGQRCIRQTDNRKWEFFPKILNEKIKQGKLMEVVDWRVIGGKDVVEEEEVRIMAYIGLWCIQEKPKTRPNMARVVQMLQGHVPVEPPPETEMMVAALLAVDRDKSGSHRRPGSSGLAYSGSTSAETDRFGSVLTGR
ncbi:hypothetical protein V2J09_002836 [Rumex salicifolius]